MAAAVGVGLAGAAGVAGGIALSSVVAAAGALTVAVHQMKAYSEHRVTENRHLGQFSGAVGNAYTRLDFNEYLRNVDLARRSSGTAANVALSVDAMRGNFQESNVFFQGASDRLAIMGASFASEIGKALIPGFQGGNNILNQIDPNGAISGGTAAGVGAFIGSLITDPGNLKPWDMLGPAQRAAQQAAAQQAAALMNPPRQENMIGQALHAMATPGPILKRPAPRR